MPRTFCSIPDAVRTIVFVIAPIQILKTIVGANIIAVKRERFARGRAPKESFKQQSVNRTAFRVPGIRSSEPYVQIAVTVERRLHQPGANEIAANPS